MSALCFVSVALSGLGKIVEMNASISVSRMGMASGRHTSSAEFIHISGHPSVACVGRWRRHGMFFSLPSPSLLSPLTVAVREA